MALRHPLVLAALSALLIWLAGRRPRYLAPASGLLGLSVATGLFPALPGVWLELGLLLVLLREPLAARHLAALLVAVNVTVVLFRPEPAWAAAVGLYEFLFLPSQAYGMLQFWQEYGPWPWWALMGFLAVVGGLVTWAPELLRGWLARWTALLRRPAVLGGLVALALWKLVAPVAVAGLVYAGVVRALTR